MALGGLRKAPRCCQRAHPGVSGSSGLPLDRGLGTRGLLRLWDLNLRIGRRNPDSNQSRELSPVSCGAEGLDPEL